MRRSLAEPRPDGVACVRVVDAPPSRQAMAWREQDRRPVLGSFVATAVAAAAA